MKMKGNQLKMRVNKKIAKVKKNGQGQTKKNVGRRKSGGGGHLHQEINGPSPYTAQRLRSSTGSWSGNAN